MASGSIEVGEAHFPAQTQSPESKDIATPPVDVSDELVGIHSLPSSSETPRKASKKKKSPTPPVMYSGKRPMLELGDSDTEQADIFHELMGIHSLPSSGETPRKASKKNTKEKKKSPTPQVMYMAKRRMLELGDSDTEQADIFDELMGIHSLPSSGETPRKASKKNTKEKKSPTPQVMYMAKRRMLELGDSDTEQADIFDELMGIHSLPSSSETPRKASKKKKSRTPPADSAIDVDVSGLLRQLIARFNRSHANRVRSMQLLYRNRLMS